MSRFLLTLTLPAFLTGCIHVKMDPIQVHAVVDVNVKMEQAVTDLISDIYGDSQTVKTESLKPNP